jgi:hypothetical protein
MIIEHFVEVILEVILMTDNNSKQLIPATFTESHKYIQPADPKPPDITPKLNPYSQSKPAQSPLTVQTNTGEPSHND